MQVMRMRSPTFMLSGTNPTKRSSAWTKRNSGLILTKIDPFLKNLHNDPRYAGLLKKLNLPN
jgi:hypothetical protein